MGQTERDFCFRGLKFLFVSPFWGDFGQELFCNTCNSFVILRAKGENWDETDFKMEVGTGCSEWVNGLYAVVV